MFFKKRPKPESPVVHATDEDFGELVERGSGVSVVEIALDYAEDGVTVVKVNTEVAPDSAGRFGIRSIPTIIFFKDGEPLFEMVGLVSKPVLEREIAQLL
jgi:thioredoxin-related protein